MTSYEAKCGLKATDAMVDSWGQEANKSTYHGQVGQTVARKEFQRPLLHSQPKA
ncbi:hypothetical protein KIM372_14650 [Bombiscardovia nodaiensis]|uniref:Transposase n=1 Tax=Bombiscardovia nodaiensis TaxID=2932181 RepID=A0ABM8B9R3_9BIFI|nr:hypothetical protein KIM372_14650 [Bombiscardovia nodaiensis]